MKILQHIDATLNVIIPVGLIGAIGWQSNWLTWGVFGFMAGYYIISMTKIGFGKPSLCALFPIGFFRLFAFRSKYYGSTILAFSLFLAGLGWQFIASLFLGHGIVFPVMVSDTILQEVYLWVSWWLVMNAGAVLGSKVLYIERSWYTRFRDAFFPVDVSERLKNAFVAKFRWDKDLFRVTKLSKDVYLLDTDNIPVSNSDLLEKRQELQNASRVVIISINPIEDSPGDYTIRTGKFLVDSEGNSTATEADLHYPDETNSRWIVSVPMLNLGYPGGGWCVDLAKTPHVGFIASQGQGKTTGIRRFIRSMAQQFPHTAFVVYDPKGGIDWHNMQWDMQEFDGLEDDEIYQAQLDTPMLQNFNLLTEHSQFKRIATMLQREYQNRSKIFKEHGCTNYVQYVNQVGYWHAEVPRIVVVIEELRFIYGSKALFNTYKDVARILELARAYGVIGVIGSQAPQQDALTQLRDSMQIFTYGATENQNEYLLGAKFRGPKMPGVCSLKLYDQSNTVVYGFVPNTTDYDASIALAEAEDIARDGGAAWEWIKSIKLQLEAEGRAQNILRNQMEYAQ